MTQKRERTKFHDRVGGKSWYIYRADKIEGPLYGKDLRRIPDRDKSGQTIFVTKNSFKKWYDLGYVRQYGINDRGVPSDLIKAVLLNDIKAEDIGKKGHKLRKKEDYRCPQTRNKKYQKTYTEADGDEGSRQ